MAGEFHMTGEYRMAGKFCMAREYRIAGEYCMNVDFHMTVFLVGFKLQFKSLCTAVVENPSWCTTTTSFQKFSQLLVPG